MANKVIDRNQFFKLGLSRNDTENITAEAYLPKSFTNYLRQTLVFTCNNALQEKFNFCFSGDLF